MLQGSLENFDLSDVLGLLSSTSKSGRLRLTGDRGTGSLWLEDGALVNGIIGVRTDAPLEEMVFELMRFTAGDFSFSADERPVQAGEPQEVVTVVQGATSRLEEWRSIESVVPSLAHIVRPVNELPSEEMTITRRDWEVLLAAGPGASVGSVCTALELGEIDGSREVKLLVDRGLLVVSEPVNAQVIERSLAAAEDAGVITDGPASEPAQRFDVTESSTEIAFQPSEFEPASFPVGLGRVADRETPIEGNEVERVEERVQESFLTRSDAPSFADARQEQLADADPTSFESDQFQAGQASAAAFESTSFEPGPFDNAAFDNSAFDNSAFDNAAFEPTSFEPTSFEPTSFEPEVFEPAVFESAAGLERPANDAAIDFGTDDRPPAPPRSIDFGAPTPPPPLSAEQRGFFGTAENDEGFVFDQMPEDAGFAGAPIAGTERPVAPGFAHAGLGVPGAGWVEERRANPTPSDWSAPVEPSSGNPGWAQQWSPETDWQATSQGPVGAPPVPQPPVGFPHAPAGATQPSPPPPGFAAGSVPPPPPPPPVPQAAPAIDFGQPFDPVAAADQTRTAIANPDLAKQEMTELLADDAKTDEGGGSLLMRYLKSER